VNLDTYIPKDAAEREALRILKEGREQYVIVEKLKKLRDRITGMERQVRRSDLDRLAQVIRDQQQKKTSSDIGCSCDVDERSRARTSSIRPSFKRQELSASGWPFGHCRPVQPAVRSEHADARSCSHRIGAGPSRVH
jgi:hypothetical protein